MKERILANEIVESNLCILACVRLIQKGKAVGVPTKFVKICYEEDNPSLTTYIQSPVEVLKTMEKIISADISLVRKYLEAKPDLKKVKKLWERMGLSTEELK